MLPFCRKLSAHLHYVITAGLAAFAIPAIHSAGLPVNLDWHAEISFYWAKLGSASVLAAFLFCVISMPFRQTFKAAWQRYRRSPVRLVLALAFLVTLILTFSPRVGILYTIAALFIIE